MKTQAELDAELIEYIKFKRTAEGIAQTLESLQSSKLSASRLRSVLGSIADDVRRLDPKS